MTNQLLNSKLINLTARIMYQSYNTIAVDDAFCMAIGEAEVEFDCDINVKLTEEIKNKIQEELQ